MQTIVILTEKPSVARDIARVIGANDDRKGWLEGSGFDGNRYQVTWCFGHLLEMYSKEVNPKWTLEDLPILPGTFSFRPIPDVDEAARKSGEKKGEGEKKESSAERRIGVIRSLFMNCDVIIAATDAGREGQAIFENVYNYIGIRKPVKRLWISSLTDNAIRDGMKSLIDNGSEQMRNLGLAARQRAEADWLVGINATRAFTLATGYRGSNGKRVVLSLGRVQTPTLKLICERYVEHTNFKSEPYWFIEGASVKDGIEFRWRGDRKYFQKHEAIVDKGIVQSGGVLVVKEAKTERKVERPPLLHDIASLQKIANSRYGYTMEDTLATAQKLYESHLITYPRTGSRYIPEDVFATIPALIGTLASDRQYGKIASALASSDRLCRRSVDNKKITDHHALLITDRRPGSGLSEMEQNVYDLIVMRVLESFSPDCVADVTNVTLLGGENVTFYTRGRKDVIQGWRAIGQIGVQDTIQADDAESIELSLKPLPVLCEGELVSIGRIEMQEDKTKPRPLLTDATLLTAMESAGRNSDNKQVVEALKDIGIGTPATRSEIVSLLVRRDYVTRSSKSLKPTNLGLTIYEAVKDLEISDVEMTARWEMALDDIKNGTGDMKAFDAGIRNYVKRATRELLASEGVKKVREAVEASRLRCPRCGADIVLYQKTAWCRPCGYTIWRDIAGKTLGDEAMRQLIKRGFTSVLKGFKGKNGDFNASVEIQGVDERGRAILHLQGEKRLPGNGKQRK